LKTNLKKLNRNKNVDITQEINTVEWFFGYGGNHIGLKRVIPNLCLRAVCEIEEYAIENILAKMENGLLEAAPIWSNCKTFPTQPFVDRVDLFIASYPCQPFSSAGKRQGENDERHLWPSVYMWIRATRPLCVFLENVEGHVSMGLSTVISDLEEAGYETAWGIFSARECLDGNNETATHQRKRVFIMAHLKNNGLEVKNRSKIQCETSGRWTLQPWGIRPCHVRELEYTSDERLSAALAIEDKQDKCRGEEHCYPTTGDGTTILWPSRPGQPQHQWEPPRIDSGCLGNAEVCNEIKPEVGGDADGASIGLDLPTMPTISNSELVEIFDWMVKGESRVDEMRLLGNGVFPSTAEKAFRTLFKELIERSI
jgi:site-specific DNA-cytosine methylase